MPGYTHGQPAEPISYGHYLAGIAEAIRRDLDYLLDAARFIDICPLGAGAVAGTGLPINTARTAELLGFSAPVSNSIDAVASRDVVLRLLAAMSILGATLSRSATDLLQWLTVEFQFLALPDELVGSSSAMPQKRNPFLLEHVQGRTASALGAFTSAIAATRNAPFTNAIAVGTESVRPLWGALRDMTDAAVLLRLVIAGARPCEERMLRRAKEGFINATATAVRLVEQKGLDFRSAHHLVGKAVTEAQDRNLVSLEDLAAAEPDVLGISLEGMDPASCVSRALYGGWPAPESLQAALVELKEGWLQQRRSIRRRVAQWATAQDNLNECVQRFVEENAVTGRAGLLQRKRAQ
jgi:argininosuccinate lyase